MSFEQDRGYGSNAPRAIDSSTDTDFRGPPTGSSTHNEEMNRRLEASFMSPYGIEKLLNRLKQSIFSAREFSAFLRERCTLEERYSQGYKKLVRNASDIIRKPEARQGSYARHFDETLRINDRLADNGLQLASNLQVMAEELREIAEKSERGRKHWKHTTLNAEKELAEAETAQSRAKDKYNNAAEQYERVRTGERQGGKLPFKNKNPAQQEDALKEKANMLDAEYSNKASLAQEQKREFETSIRPGIARALQDIIAECDAVLALQMAKLASFSEKHLVSNAMAVAPIRSSDASGPDPRGLRHAAQDVNNDRDFMDYMTDGVEPPPQFKGNRSRRGTGTGTGMRADTDLANAPIQTTTNVYGDRPSLDAPSYHENNYRSTSGHVDSTAPQLPPFGEDRSEPLGKSFEMERPGASSNRHSMLAGQSDSLSKPAYQAQQTGITQDSTSLLGAGRGAPAVPSLPSYDRGQPQSHDTGFGAPPRSNTGGLGSQNTSNTYGLGSTDRSNTGGPGNQTTSNLFGPGSSDRSNTGVLGGQSTSNQYGTGNNDRSNIGVLGNQNTSNAYGPGNNDRSNTGVLGNQNTSNTYHPGSSDKPNTGLFGGQNTSDAYGLGNSDRSNTGVLGTQNASNTYGPGSSDASYIDRLAGGPTRQGTMPLNNSGSGTGSILPQNSMSPTNYGVGEQSRHDPLKQNTLTGGSAILAQREGPGQSTFGHPAGQPPRQNTLGNDFERGNGPARQATMPSSTFNAPLGQQRQDTVGHNNNFDRSGGLSGQTPLTNDYRGSSSPTSNMPNQSGRGLAATTAAAAPSAIAGFSGNRNQPAPGSYEDPGRVQNPYTTNLAGRGQAPVAGRGVLPSQQPPRQALPPTNPVFGMSLDELFRRDGSAVPAIVFQCVQAIDSFGLNQEGIYRVSGSGPTVMQLKSEFDHDSNLVKLVTPSSFGNDINSVATLLKNFLRDLSDSLTTNAAYTSFIQAAKYEDSIMRRDALHQNINSLPDPNYATLRVITLHLHRIAMNSDVNKMDIKNLSIVLGPTIMGGASNVGDAGWQTKVMETLLMHTHDIFDPDEE